MTKTKIPTVDQFLYCLVGRGENLNEILATYAALGFHYDGKDRSADTVRSIKRFVEKIDGEAAKLIDEAGGVKVVDEPGSDDVYVVYGGEGYQFRAATLKDKISAPESNLGAWIREMIETLGDPRLLSLPYPATASITEAASKVAGFL